ncbi:pyridoxal phosphate-dependent aminotransferase [Halorubrum vacuolatum]|uniref:Aminotransferase n=1 Tax=Halorubrum vacuolatum TaxID=63740 RepID=A0A238XUU2_HALVU|nr:threonine-phosphate decarboxylase [Halorubrum vacuolatum]SNR62291.1 L-threonine O-3-phosphate decarboxylase [Halorubrum vacuolatum]
MDSNALDAVERVRHGGTIDPHVVDFSTNTNPERPSGITPVYDAALAASRRYPPDDHGEFRAAAAEYVGCEPTQVIPTAGVVAGMRLAFSVVLDPGDSAIVPEPTAGEYAREIRLQGATPVGVAHDEVLEVDPESHDLVVVCNPNNPTGETVETDDLRSFAARCRDAGTTLFVDETFLGFTRRPSVAGEPGIVVVRSLTKMFGLPGLRAGYLVASGKTYDRLDVARVSWAVSTPAVDVGTYCLGREEFVERTRKRVEAERLRMADRLAERWTVYPSDAPFLLFDVGTDDPDDVLDMAREQRFALRDARKFTRLDNHLRVAVRRPRENERLLEALTL